MMNPDIALYVVSGTPKEGNEAVTASSCIKNKYF